MSAEMDRVAKLDLCKSWSVEIGEREFFVKPLPFPRLKEIMEIVHTDDGEATEEEVVAEEAKKSFIDMLFSDWEKSLPVFCLILGYEKDKGDYETVYNHLHQCLTPPDALGVYDKFWEVNRLEDFLNRAGRLLLTTSQFHGLLEQVKAG